MKHSAPDCLVGVTNRYVAVKARRFGFRVSSFEFLIVETAHVQKRTQIYQYRQFRSPASDGTRGGDNPKSVCGASKPQRYKCAGCPVAARRNFNYNTKISSVPQCNRVQLEYRSWSRRAANSLGFWRFPVAIRGRCSLHHAGHRPFPLSERACKARCGGTEL